MWVVVAWMVLLPLGWALAGAPDIAGFDPLDLDRLPADLAQGAPIAWQALVGAVAVGVLLALGPTARITMHMGTAVHEIGHGLTAAALGGVVSRITMAPDGSGLATTGLPQRARVRVALVSLAGYLAPGILGLASLQMAVAGHGPIWLAYLTGVTVVMLLLAMRSWWAILVAALGAAAGWAVLHVGAGWAATVSIAALAGLYLARGLADTGNQLRALRQGATTDAWRLSRQTGLPARLFAGVQAALALGMAVTGVWLLLPG